MKNPLEKEDHTGVIVLGVAAAIAAASLAYLYLTEDGGNTRRSLKHKIKDEVKDFASGIVSKKIGLSKKTVKKVADFISK